MIRTLRPDDVDECAAILSSLGRWFGNPVSNAAYIDALAHEPAFVATVDGEVRGFLALTLHNAGAAEILVMALPRTSIASLSVVISSERPRSGVEAEVCLGSM